MKKLTVAVAEDEARAAREAGADAPRSERELLLESLEIENATERRSLESVARGGPLPHILTQLVLGYESLLHGLRGSVLLLDPSGLHLRHGAAPHLPREYCEAIDGVAIGPSVGSCGTAAYTGQATVVADIAHDPRWREFSDLAQAHGLGACWSVPILGTSGRVLGTFAFYSAGPRAALASELATLERAAHLASMAIERHMAEAAVRASEALLEQAFGASPIGMALVGLDNRCLKANRALCRMLGRSETELIGSCFQDITHPDDTPTTDEPTYRELLAGTRETFQKEKRYLRKDGRAIWTQLNVSVVRDAAGAPVHMVGQVQDITERQQAEETLREGQERLRVVVDTALDAVIGMDAAGMVTEWNAQAERIFGWTRQEAVGQALGQLIVPEEHREAHERGLRRYVASGESSVLNKRIEIRARRRNGEEFPVELAITPARVGDTTLFSAFLRDVTERKRFELEKAKLETNLRQATKMESVGRLAGGVAHDFNNMLSVILGHAALALETVDPSEPIHADLVEIQRAAERSADLTRQLLAFARRQTVAPKVVDVNATVAEMLKMLPRLLGEDVQVTWQPDAKPWPIKIDPSQIEQIVTNLCVNARDAIAGVGGIAIKTANRTIDEAYCREHAGAAPGEYLRLTVSDDGAGMEKDVLANIFEPFFTTKVAGRGTGLGLATVYGAVVQNNGFIVVASEPGKGATFEVHFPRYLGAAEPDRTAKAAGPSPRGQETILLVEDEPAILKVTTRMLEALGYAVLGASSPGEAVRVAAEHPHEIHLLITDVIMPDMNGRDLVAALSKASPRTRHLFMSGYTADIVARQGVLDDGMNFLSKPFTKGDLALKVREVLDSRPGPTNG